jgi:glyoxalase family protein
VEITGLHHVTAVTAHAKQNLRFYTDILGLRLVKKTVNQDDVSAYHLYYADKVGTPGTDITFFDWEHVDPKQPGTTDVIESTLFRVNDNSSIAYWLDRLDSHGVTHSGISDLDGHQAIYFVDNEGQSLAVVADEQAVFEGIIWDQTDIPTQHALKGFYAVQIAVPFADGIEQILVKVLDWAKGSTYQNPDGYTYQIYTMNGGGPGKEVHIRELVDALPNHMTTAGSVHHVAFRVKDEATLYKWIDRISEFGIPNSSFVDRFYFKSLYFRVSQGILFELATDGPGFDIDEDRESLGAILSLPPFLEHRRSEIEAQLKSLD